MKVVVEVNGVFKNTRVYRSMTTRRIAAKAQKPIDRRYLG
jgi:hypothetical protein